MEFITSISALDERADSEQLDIMHKKFEDLQKQQADCNINVSESTQETKNDSNNICDHNDVTLQTSMTKLTADIESDKLAAQRATEQNNKLKADVENLEQVIVKLGKDKLELTEKWTHEKQLNKGLALKLAEIEENVRFIQNQVKAKDEEMIRLINEHREIEHKYESVLNELHEMKKFNKDGIGSENFKGVVETDDGKLIELEKTTEVALTAQTDNKVKLDDMVIEKEDAMIKLQERFLNIMDEVASLSDEKHRLEHIILQLQNETDTICEYVALYQQQRSLLKKREEERSNQLKLFQTECDKLKHHLEELKNLLLRFAADEEIALCLKEETRHNDFARVQELLKKLQNCPIINPYFNNLDLNLFYPCNCCSGQLLDV